MASVRSQILSAIVAALGGTGKPTGLTVSRFGIEAVESEALPYMSVRLAEEQSKAIDGRNGLGMERTLMVDIECRAAGDEPDDAVDPLIVWVTEALQDDRSLGGLATDLEEIGLEWSAEDAMENLGLAVVRIRVDYDTDRNNQENHL